MYVTLANVHFAAPVVATDRTLFNVFGSAELAVPAPDHAG